MFSLFTCMLQVEGGDAVVSAGWEVGSLEVGGLALSGEVEE